MTLPSGLKQGSLLMAINVVHPGGATPITITIVDLAGNDVCRWLVTDRKILYWADMVGVLLTDDVVISTNGPLAAAKGDFRWRPPTG